MLDTPGGVPVAGNARILKRISDAELARRASALRRAMAAQQLDALVFQSQNDWLGGYVKWLTDLPAQNGYPRSVIFYADAPMTVVEMGAFAANRDYAGVDVLHRGVGEWHGSPSFLAINYTQAYDGAIVAAALQRHCAKRIGLVGAGAMPHRFVQVITEACAGSAALSDATDLVDIIKAVKSAEEISLIRQAARLQDEVFAEVLRIIRPGMRDIDVTTHAQAFAQLRGSEQGIFLCGSSPLGQRASFLGRHMQGRTLAVGDHLSLLIEINGPGGFYTEIARTIVLGRASAEVLDGFAAMQAAQNLTLSLIKPGASCAAIAAAHDAFMQARGLPVERRLYAHGQGYDMVERPMIRHDETMEMAADMCLAVHPGFETEQLFAVICDNYLVTGTGVSACLHNTAKKIFEIT
jgi:Xaa-Pro aminopeptidase